MASSVRSARLAKLVQRVVAGDLERSLHDPRLLDVTVTEVRVTGDLQEARIYWTQLGQSGKARGERKRAAEALEQSKGRLRTHVGRVAGLRLTPVLVFVYDEVPEQAREIDDVLRDARRRDEQLAEQRQGKKFAGDEDPYRHPEEEDGDGDEEDDTADGGDVDIDIVDAGDAQAGGPAESETRTDADGGGGNHMDSSDTGLD